MLKEAVKALHAYGEAMKLPPCLRGGLGWGFIF